MTPLMAKHYFHQIRSYCIGHGYHNTISITCVQAALKHKANALAPLSVCLGKL